MSNQNLPREQLSPYQRWELHSFDSPNGRDGAAAVLPTASQLEQMHQQAHAEGYAAGRREGSARVAAEAQRLQQIVAALSEDSRRFDEGIADDLLKLALAISKQILKQALALHPEMILAAVREVLAQVPLSHRGARLIVHPEDVELVRQSLGEQIDRSGWEILASTDIGRGGCRLESAECQVDATMEQRWLRVAEALGSNDAWSG